MLNSFFSKGAANREIATINIVNEDRGHQQREHGRHAPRMWLLNFGIGCRCRV